MNIDPFKIPLKEAQNWCRNWINLPENEKDLADDKKYKPKDMRAFLISKKDLNTLCEAAPEAEYVRFYIGLRDDSDKKIPHLLMVNAHGDSPKTAKDLVTDDDSTDALGDSYPVNDFSHPCPNTCDPSSPLYVN